MSETTPNVDDVMAEMAWWDAVTAAHEVTRLRSALAAARREVETLRDRCAKEDDEMCQILGRALGYPRFADDQENFPGATDAEGVCVGEHVAVTLAVEAARRIETVTRERDEARAALEDVRRVEAWLMQQPLTHYIARNYDGHYEATAAGRVVPNTEAKADSIEALGRALAQEAEDNG